ncbi:MAG: transcriptional regulator [Acidobacteriota bacterium]|jgi:DNA-binding MarR family transcriptional regulator|nr:transcriptional regulator [Acidobacteriota bacterium]
MAKNRKATRPTPNELDPLIHERLRLGILSALVVQESLTFTELRDILQTTDGNLSVQARRLESAGYVFCDKKFEDRKPRSTYRLSPEGRAALEEYLEKLSSLLPDRAQVRNARTSSLGAGVHPLPSHS